MSPIASYAALGAAIVLEVVGTTFLQKSEQFTKAVPTAVMAVCYLNRTRTIYNWLQYFDLETIKAEFFRSGLKIVDVFSNAAGKPFDHQSTEFAVVAEHF